MSASVSQETLKELVLIELFKHAQHGQEALFVEDVAALLDGRFGEHRVKLALESLEQESFARSSYARGRGFKYLISEAGYLEAESYGIGESINSLEDVASDPIEDFEQRLAPASGRLVSFGDNQDSKEQAISTIEAAEEIVRSSNQIDEDTREQTLLSVKTGKDFLAASKSFSVGAFKFLIWDRLKAVLESAIEESYKIALTALLMTLGAIIVGLL